MALFRPDWNVEPIEWETVVRALEDTFAQENQAHPLSDQAVADSLASRGLPIARRTVIKWRNKMGIPPREGRGKL